MIPRITTLLAGYTMQIAIGAGLLVMVVAWDAKRINRAEKRGQEQVVTASKEAGAKANATNEKIRRESARPGAAERLLADSCRDCKQR